MSNLLRIFLSAAAGLALLASAPAYAQMDGEVEGAMTAGAVGEQADGYLGFVRAPSSTLKAKVDAINIKRREGYTRIAQSKNVPIEAFAASIGCKTLGSLQSGRAYSVARGAWAVKSGAPIALPDQCG
ncbi:YdbL family protein [uncultured Sphingomonas sp.]|uniref:YdbL family protein n=1 Tax=uncultured Sphingomonas sp. TaxID=158754 RepID=UPI0025E456B1|nr:YdbL family protein [uncultured Sphingomonas sp.]